MKEILVPIITALISSGVVGMITTALMKKISDGDPTKKAVKLILQDRLEFLCRKYISRGWLTIDEKKFVFDAAEAYHGVGGNGYFKLLIDEVEHLPTREGDKDGKQDLKKAAS